MTLSIKGLIQNENNLKEELRTCRNEDSVLESFPDELLLSIFRFLPIQSQYHTSLVSKRWNRLAKDHTLEFGQVLILSKLVLKQPLIVHLINNKESSVLQHRKKRYFIFHGLNSKYYFLSDNQPSTPLFLIARKTNKVTEVYLDKALKENEKQRIDLKKQELSSVIPLNEENFITVSEKGTISKWIIEADQVKCINHIQFFKEDELKMMAQTEINEPESSGLHKAGRMGDKLFFKVTKPDSIYWKVSNLEFNMEHLSSDNVSLQIDDFDPSYKINSTYLFDISLKEEQAFLRFIQIDEKHHFKIQSTLPLKNTIEGDSRFQVMAANDLWVVVASYYQKTDLGPNNEVSYSNQIAVYHIFDAVKRVEKYKFREDFSHLSSIYKTMFFFPERSLGWLCGDIFAIWPKNQLKIFHLGFQCYLTTLPLEHFSWFFDPVVHFSVEKDEIKILIQNLSNFQLSEVVYTINSPDSINMDMEELPKKLRIEIESVSNNKDSKVALFNPLLNIVKNFRKYLGF